MVSFMASLLATDRRLAVTSDQCSPEEALHLEHPYYWNKETERKKDKTVKEVKELKRTVSIYSDWNQKPSVSRSPSVVRSQDINRDGKKVHQSDLKILANSPVF